jgi:hypothetical protein
MSDDPMTWIKSEISTRKHHGERETTPNALASDFLRIDAARRATILSDLDRKLSQASLTLNESVELHRFRRALVNANNIARRVNR